MEEKHCKWYNDEFCTNGDSPCVADYCPVVEYPELCKCRELDEDTSVCSKDDTDTNVGMTNEEIIKALEMGSKCCKHNYLEYWELVRACQNGLDLIQHLQGENAGLKERGEIVINSLHETIDTQKAEIERLTDDNELKTAQVGLLTGQVEYLKMCGDNFLADYQKAQKQVDELKEKIMNIKSAMISRVAMKSYDTMLTTPEDVEEIFGDAYESEFNKFLEQAEKDAAKEIIKWIKRNGILEYGGYVIHDSTIEQMCKKYGVEVE